MISVHLTFPHWSCLRSHYFLFSALKTSLKMWKSKQNMKLYSVWKLLFKFLWHNQQCYFLKQQTLIIYRNLIFLRANYELDPAVNITSLTREEAREEIKRQEMLWLTHVDCPAMPVRSELEFQLHLLPPAPTFRLKQVIPHLDLFTVLPHLHSFFFFF